MGVCINYKIGIPSKQNVIRTLDKAEQVAGYYAKQANELGIKMQIQRDSELLLRIDTTGCETMVYNFKTAKEILSSRNTGEYDYTYSVLTDGGKNTLQAGYEIELYPQNEMLYCADFCKTQYAGDLFAHKALAEIVRVIAGRASYAEVNDEGDYYYTGDITDAGKAIAENASVINKVMGQLKDAGYKAENIITNKTEL